MEVLSPSATTITPHIFPRKAHKSQPQNPTVNIKFPKPPNKRNHLHLSFSSSSFISFICFSSIPSASLTSTSKTFLTPSDNHHWIVLMEAPPQGVNSKPEVINYYVNTLARVLGSEKDAQMCIYHTSCDSPSAFAVTLTRILPASSHILCLGRSCERRFHCYLCAANVLLVYLRFYRLGPTRIIQLTNRKYSVVSCGEYQSLACSDGQAGGWSCYKGTND